MSRKATIVGFAIVSTLLAEVGSAQDASGTIDSTPKPTTIAMLRKNASAFKNVCVTFTGQFMSLGNVHNPFFTRFTRSDYVNFAMWGDNQKIWEESEYGNPLGTLFVSKKVGEELLDKLYTLQRYQRLEIVGIVHHVFQGEPWIEVMSIVEIGDKVNVTTLQHMARGRELMRARKWVRAAQEMNLATTSGLPDSVVGWIHNYLGVCFMRTGRASQAIGEFKLAKSYLKHEHEPAQNLAMMMADPKSGIDKTIIDGRIPRARRPMWEAYERSLADEQKAKRGISTQPGR